MLTGDLNSDTQEASKQTVKQANSQASKQTNKQTNKKASKCTWVRTGRRGERGSGNGFGFAIAAEGELTSVKYQPDAAVACNTQTRTQTYRHT